MTNEKLVGKMMRAEGAIWQQWLSLLCGQIAVDPGSANTRIFVAGHGVVVNEPSVIAFHEDGHIIAVGQKARLMLERASSSVRVVQPIRSGVIAAHAAAEQMLRHFIQQALRQHWLIRPRVLVCVSGEMTSVESRAIEDSLRRTGVSKLNFVAEPFAAAVGVGLDVEAARALMVVDLGAGTTDVAILSAGTVIRAVTLQHGGEEIERAIIQYLHDQRHLEVGATTAEAVKIRLGSALRERDEQSMEVEGRCLYRQRPMKAVVTGAEIRAALEPVIYKIAQGVLNALTDLSPQVSADLMESGMTCTGGGAQLAGLPEFLGQQTGLEVRVAPNPTLVTVLGAGRLLKPEAAEGVMSPVSAGKSSPFSPAPH